MDFPFAILALTGLPLLLILGYLSAKYSKTENLISFLSFCGVVFFLIVSPSVAGWIVGKKINLAIGSFIGIVYLVLGIFVSILGMYFSIPQHERRWI